MGRSSYGRDRDRYDDRRPRYDDRYGDRSYGSSRGYSDRSYERSDDRYSARSYERWPAYERYPMDYRTHEAPYPPHESEYSYRQPREYPSSGRSERYGHYSPYSRTRRSP